MSTVLFNFHDLVLVLTAFECILFAILIWIISSKNLKTALFSLFLLCHALIPIHELIFWGEKFRLWMLDLSPNLFFIGSYAYFIDGVLLFLFVKALLYKNYMLQKSTALHLLPLLAYVIQMVFSFYLLSPAEKIEAIETQQIVYSSPYLYYDSLSRFIRVVYALACVFTLFKYSNQLRQCYGTIQHSTLIWLKIMVLSILALYIWDSVLAFLKIYYLNIGSFDLPVLEFVGTSAYHLTFVVLNILIFLKLSLFQNIAVVEKFSYSDQLAPEAEGFSPALISQIEDTISDTKIYCKESLSLDDLSAATSIPSRKLSQIIKSHYGKNFYEFINSYRVEEAKRLLTSPKYRDRTIMEVYLDAGFNSKSVFNTFFKSSENMTPSEYKKRHTQ